MPSLYKETNNVVGAARKRRRRREKSQKGQGLVCMLLCQHSTCPVPSVLQPLWPRAPKLGTVVQEAEATKPGHAAAKGAEQGLRATVVCL